jgi:hypothetical protein
MSQYEQPEIPGIEVQPCNSDRITYRTLGGYEVREDGLRVTDSFWEDETLSEQPLDIAPSELPTKSKFGEYWIEFVYKKIGGKTYGPYRVKRWRDGNGRKRCEYLGKVKAEPAPDK